MPHCRDQSRNCALSDRRMECDQFSQSEVSGYWFMVLVTSSASSADNGVAEADNEADNSDVHLWRTRDFSVAPRSARSRAGRVSRRSYIVKPIESKAQNPLQSLQTYGQSVWLDYIRRSLITSGELKRLLDEDGLRGVTSNPSIFEKAIVGSTDYKDILEASESRGLDAKSLYEKLAIRDIQNAADLLRPVYKRSKRRDGYVSLEVAPTLAHDTEGTLKEARRLWQAVGR